VSLEAVAAGLRRDSSDLALYGGFLISTVLEALPPEMVAVERHRTATDRLRGRPGEVVSVAVDLADHRYTLRRRAVGVRPEATVAHQSGGITMSSDTVPLDVWARRLAEDLVARAGADAAAADAAARLAVPRGSDL
jgi:hypothetical protein